LTTAGAPSALKRASISGAAARLRCCAVGAPPVAVVPVVVRGVLALEAPVAG